MKVLFSILMVLLVSLTTAKEDTEYSTLIDVFATIQNPCDDLRNGQFICKDCATLAFCVQENGLWNSMEITTCNTKSGLYCDEEARGCIFKTECISRGPKFECQNAGTFPDPYDCKQYHVCDASMADERKICPQGTAYSPATKSCSLSSSNDICFKAQYKCDHLLDMAPWPSDSNIYYVCWQTNFNGDMVSYPLLHRCPDGYQFKNNGCVPRSTDNVITTAAPVSTTAAAGTSCDLGSGLKINSEECYSYYVCANGQLVNKKCPSETYFDKKSLSCQFGSC